MKQLITIDSYFPGFCLRVQQLDVPPVQSQEIIFQYILLLLLKNMLQNLNVREVAWLKRELREIVGRGSSVLLLENESKVCVDVADRLEVIA